MRHRLLPWPVLAAGAAGAVGALRGCRKSICVRTPVLERQAKPR